MDPFEVRMQFVHLMRGLNASQNSIHKVVRFALKYFSKCGDDLWDCVVEECQKGTVNTRINILYMLDTLCELSEVAYSSQSLPPPENGRGPLYVEFVRKDLAKIVDMVVPEGREGLPNLTSTTQILESWRAKRIVDPSTIDDVMGTLDRRKEAIQDSDTGTNSTTFTKHEIMKRIEEDRERVRHPIPPLSPSPNTAS